MTRTVEKYVPHMSPMTGSSWSPERQRLLPVRERHKGASGTHARCLCLIWIQPGEPRSIIEMKSYAKENDYFKGNVYKTVERILVLWQFYSLL